MERQAASSWRLAFGRLSQRRVAPWPTRVLMSSIVRRCVVWLTAGAFLCAAAGEGALHLLLDLSALPFSGASSSAHDGPTHACCAHHSPASSDRHRVPSSCEPALSAEDDANGHDPGACPICQFSAMAKSVQVPAAPLFALLPTAAAPIARPVVSLTQSRPAHLPRGPPRSLVLSVC